ncbi:MAG: beta-ketoacyl synthase N-terminal-like domain-containing protein, partial [Candidatus Omnitrophota bacterium]|nr:beta-ketoacyl synthase N-terminal-like domain-containing protein [Candidatus Omnitrophota bacterium]
MKRRVVVTGLGVVSSIGIGKDEFWKNLTAGKSGINDISEFYSSNYALHRGGIVKDFKPAKDM